MPKFASVFPDDEMCGSEEHSPVTAFFFVDDYFVIVHVVEYSSARSTLEHFFSRSALSPFSVLFFFPLSFFGLRYSTRTA